MNWKFTATTQNSGKKQGKMKVVLVLCFQLHMKWEEFVFVAFRWK